MRLAQAATLATDIPRHRAQNLTQRGSIAPVDPDGQTCLLRITRAEKLILTK
ncbi:MAG: hemin uptake protein HemP [Rhodobacteraceae bacterium]|nr:hemin uptake protein HemP [Paracoccaceae bacterium]TVR49770.1 MAG: hemin uptake protein HemP [Paracoccaceae bacterium]